MRKLIFLHCESWFAWKINIYDVLQTICKHTNSNIIHHLKMFDKFVLWNKFETKCVFEMRISFFKFQSDINPQKDFTMEKLMKKINVKNNDLQIETYFTKTNDQKNGILFVIFLN